MTRYAGLLFQYHQILQKDVVEGYKLGANSYIQKPVDSKKFMESIKLLGLYWTLWNKLPIVAK